MLKIFFTIICCILFSTTLFANPITNFPLLWNVTSGDYELWTDGINVKIDTSGDYLQVSLDASQLTENDYYTFHIYKTGAFDWGSYGELAFNLENLSSEALKFNFTITDRYNNIYNLTEGMPVLTLHKNSNIKELIANTWGSAEIPASFVGEVHIPDYNATASSLESIISFGVSITVPKGISQSFLMSNIFLVPDEYASGAYGFNIVGDSQIQLPVIGETIAQYSVVFKDIYSQSDTSFQSKNVSFSILDDVEGVSITNDGRLTVQSDLSSNTFRVSVDINSEIRDSMLVTVIDHWSKDPALASDTKPYLPRPDEVASLKNEDNPLFGSSSLNALRFISVAVAVILFRLYFVCMNMWKGGLNEK